MMSSLGAIGLKPDTHTNTSTSTTNTHTIRIQLRPSNNFDSGPPKLFEGTPPPHL